MIRNARLPLSLCALCALRGASSSALPTLTSLYPGGAARGSTVEVAAAGTFDAWPVRGWASDPAVTVTAGKTKGALTVAVGPAAVPGVCWLRLADDTGASPLRPFVVGVLPDVAEAEPNDDAAKPQAVPGPAVVNGKLAKAGDVDCFAVMVAKGRTLVASLEAHDHLRSPMDAVLQVVSPAGAVLAQNHDHRRLDPQLTFTAPADGVIVVRLFAFPAQPDSTIRHFGSEACVYRLTLTTAGFVDHVTPLSAERGKTADLTLHGWNLPARTHRLPADADRVTPPGCANGGAVDRPAHPCHDLTAGPPAGPLTPPFTATGVVAASSGVSTVPFAAMKGPPLTIGLQTASVGSPLTPVARVVDAAGRELARFEPRELHADAETAFTPPADGVYRVEVRDLFGDGGPRHVFRLRAATPRPDFAPAVAADRFTVTAGQPLDVPVTVGASHGFAGELDWAVEGLPPGVTARAVLSAGKPDPNAVTLRFKAVKAGVGGPVRVVATARREPSVKRAAAARLADFDILTTDLWLTAVPPAAKK